MTNEEKENSLPGLLQQKKIDWHLKNLNKNIVCKTFFQHHGNKPLAWAHGQSKHCHTRLQCHPPS
jgi:hypothetical protein